MLYIAAEVIAGDSIGVLKSTGVYGNNGDFII
jgi:hypothetical protein